MFERLVLKLKTYGLWNSRTTRFWCIRLETLRSRDGRPANVRKSRRTRCKLDSDESRPRPISNLNPNRKIYSMRFLHSMFFILTVFFFSTTASAQAYCPSGYPVDCGNNRCCPSGYTCGGTCGGECCGTTPNGGGGGTCPTGYPNNCGNGRCCPSGSTCGGSCGGECCYMTGGGGNTVQPPQTGGGTTVCQDDDAHGSGCTRLQACVGPGQAYYDVDGKKSIAVLPLVKKQLKRP